MGYTEEIIESYLEDIGALVELWTNQGFIEVYSDNADKKYGRAKSSNTAPNSSPWYIGVYHARLLKTGENDPLIVVVFEEMNEDNELTTVASLRFMLDHDDIFGRLNSKDKFSPERLRAIRKSIDAFIQEGGARLA